MFTSDPAVTKTSCSQVDLPAVALGSLGRAWAFDGSLGGGIAPSGCRRPERITLSCSRATPRALLGETI
jgi:hypothetical protein